MSSSVVQMEFRCKTGSESLAAKYAAATPGGHFKLVSRKEYAKMWMGTYPTSPALLLFSEEDLQKLINAYTQ
jgi:mannose-6-phosphate isomerase